MSFTPENYQPPKSNSNYMKMLDGDNIIRILSKPIMGWLDWKEENGKRTPIRTPYNQPKPTPIDPAKSVKHFWAMTIWDYREKTIKILEITQSSIQEALYNLDVDEAWGEPTLYDINIKKSGEKLETKYAVIARPPKDITEEIKTAFIKINPNLNALFSNADPFASKGQEQDEYSQPIPADDYLQPELDGEEEIKAEDIPF